MKWMLWGTTVIVLSGCAKDAFSACEHYLAVSAACAAQAGASSTADSTTSTVDFCAPYDGLTGPANKDAANMFNCMMETLVAADCFTVDGYLAGQTAALACGDGAVPTGSVPGTTTLSTATGSTTPTGSANIAITPTDCCTFEHSGGNTPCPQEVGSISFTNSDTETASHTVSCQLVYDTSLVEFQRSTTEAPQPAINGPLPTGTQTYSILFNCADNMPFSTSCTAEFNDAEGTTQTRDFQVTGTFL
jgi:hypothetical protein